jgi:hypothetical protein
MWKGICAIFIIFMRTEESYAVLLFLFNMITDIISFRKEQGFPKDIDELIEKRKIEEGKGNKFNYKATTVR